MSTARRQELQQMQRQLRRAGERAKLRLAILERRLPERGRRRGRVNVAR